MVEEADILLNESDAQLLGRLKDRLVVLATSGGGNVLGARLGSAVDVVGERELR